MNNGNLSIEEKAFFYSLNTYKAAVFEQRMEFDRDIDKDKLNLALKETIKYFIRFRMKAVISKEGKPELALNDAELPIFDDNNQIYQVGTKETNGYLYALSVKGPKLRITLFHVLCDGKGSGYFINTLVLYYIKFAYGDDITVEIEKYNLGDENHNKNLKDIIELYVNNKLKNEITKPLEYPDQKKVFLVDKEVNYFYDNSFFTASIEWDTKALIDIVHKYETTPFVFFFMLIADAMIECFDVVEDEIIANAAVDLRKFLNSNSFYNFGTSINVSYIKKWHKLPIEDKIKNLKENFAETLNYNDMVANIYKIEQMMKKFGDMQNIDWLKKQREENCGKINCPLFSCFISNVGKIIMPDVIKKHIVNQETFTTPINVISDYTMFSYEETGIITQNQNFTNEKIMKKIFEELEKFGVKSKYIEEKQIELSHFDTLKLERTDN